MEYMMKCEHCGSEMELPTCTNEEVEQINNGQFLADPRYRCKKCKSKGPHLRGKDGETWKKLNNLKY